MVLSMSRPFKHPTTHVYYYRRVVPDDLRQVVGKREEKRSLGTKDPEEAKTRHAWVAAEVEARWRELRRGVQPVSHKQAHAVAGELYRDLLARNEDQPETADSYRDRQVAHERIATEGLGVFATLPSLAEQLRLSAAMQETDDAVSGFLATRGMRVDGDAFGRMRSATAAGLAQGHGTLARYANGDYRPDPNAGRFPDRSAIDGKRDALTAKALFDAYQREAKVAPATDKRWRGVFAALVRFLGRDDMRAVTEGDLLRWKQTLLESGKSNQTIRNVYLASVKAVFRFALSEKLLPSNPAASVTIKSAKKKRLREQGFTKDEALLILRATLEPASKRTSPEFAAARQWVPWLCAYSGARVNEITQLRASDIVVIRSGDVDVPCMRITPEAGSVKSGEARDVAIHPHLVDMGFLDYVKTRKGRHLFYDPGRNKGGKDGNPQYKKVGEKLAAWVRGLGVDDPAILPNHAWRHRFKSLARAVEIPEGICDTIVGHAPSTVGQSYGDLWHEVMAREIAKLSIGPEH